MSTRIVVMNEVNKKYPQWNSELCFQRAVYAYDKDPEMGYRFIWRNDGKLLAHRGQARIPDKATLLELIDRAEKAGWLN